MINKLKSNTNQHKIIISMSGLTKKYRSKVVLSNIDLQINRGNSIAFVGRNGCGKSTILKIIAGVLPFDKGEVKYNNKLAFCYVPERFPAMNLTVRKYITQISAIAGLRKEDINKRSMQLFESLFMCDMIDTPIQYLSKGTIQKVAVVQAFLTRPDVLILDEPVSGQDIASQHVFTEMVNILNREYGVTILCSCHEDYMIKALAQSVYEISKGKLLEIKQENMHDINSLFKLLFVNKHSTEAVNIPSAVIDLSVKVEWLEGQEVAVFVTASESDKIIREMLNSDFELRGLNNERIY